MFVDASAIVAVLLREDGYRDFATRIFQTDRTLYISPLVRFEAAAAVSRQRNVRSGATEPFEESARIVDQFAERAHAREIDVTAKIGKLALAANARYGKASGHPARLNFGDCFAYACAKSLGVGLLYKGDDFAKTDLG